MLAELVHSRAYKEKTISKVKFVFEIKNNTYPLVLLTKFDTSPNIEAWEGIKDFVTIPEGIEYQPYNAYYERIIPSDNSGVFTQYCSFEKKKNKELMASHPSFLHEGFSKITQHCEETVRACEESLTYDVDGCGRDIKCEIFRHFIHLPVLLLNNDLYELREQKLHKVLIGICFFAQHPYHPQFTIKQA